MADCGAQNGGVFMSSLKVNQIRKRLKALFEAHLDLTVC
jgi:hypothetical protein